MSLIGKSKENFNQEFLSGKWKYLNTLEELGHYSIISGYIRFYYNTPKILDVGCGTGIILNQFTQGTYSMYHGIDFSKEAIKLFNKDVKKKVDLFVTDINDFETQNKYDVIIFCESLYYFDNIKEILKKYIKFLEQNGKIIISCYNEFATRSFWSNIPSEIILLSSDRVISSKGHKWDVKLFEIRSYAK